MKTLKIAVLLVFIFLLNNAIYGLKIEFANKVRLSNNVLLQFPISFSVTEDNLFLVVDFKGRDVKIYKNNGELLNVLGQKGSGPNEFGLPLFCHYSNGKFIISDVGQKRIFLYERKDKFNFVRTREIRCTVVGDDLHLDGNKLYIAGNKSTGEGKSYSFFVSHLDHLDHLDKDGHYTYFLPAYLKFGLASFGQYKTELFKKLDITAIGTSGIFDIHGDFAYYTWEGDLKIFRINLKTKEITTFGKKMPHYVKPYASKKLIEALKSRQGKYIIKEKRKMSYVKQIFTTRKHVLLIYAIPAPKDVEPGYMMQFYTLGGNFVKEVPIPGEVTRTMCFVQPGNALYTVVSEPDDELEEAWCLLKYKVNEIK